MRFKLLEEYDKIIAYHGSQTDNLIIWDRPLYLVNDKEMAEKFALGYNFNYNLLDDETPTVYKIAIEPGNYKEIYSEEEYETIMDIVNIEDTLRDYSEYDGIIYTDNDLTYYLIFNPKEKCKIIDKEILQESLLEDIQHEYTYQDILEIINKMDSSGYPIEFNNIESNIILLSPDGTSVGIDNWDTHSDFGDELYNYIYENFPELYSQIESQMDASYGYDIIDIIEDMGFITLNSGGMPEEPRRKIVIMTKPSNLQYNFIEDWLNLGDEKVYVYCRGTAKYYSLVENTPRDIIKKIQRYFISRVLEEQLGYRTETAYGSGVRDLREILDFEIIELGNVDIPATIVKNFPMKNNFERMLLNHFVEEPETYSRKQKYDIVKLCQWIILRKYPKAKYALWLADKDAVKTYYGGTEEDIDEYETEYDIPISDLGNEGKLYLYSEIPEKINKDE